MSAALSIIGLALTAFGAWGTRQRVPRSKGSTPNAAFPIERPNLGGVPRTVRITMSLGTDDPKAI